MTARKTPAKKAAPKSAAAKVQDFEEFRSRAAVAGVTASKRLEPYVIDGFDPPVAVDVPPLSQRILLDRAIRTGSFSDALEILIGSEFMRVVKAFEKFDDGEVLLAGLVFAIVDHFVGQGASDVPGGTPAS